MEFICSESRQRAWRDETLERARRAPEEDLDLPDHIRADRERAVRTAFWRHAMIAVRHPSPSRRLRRSAFVAAKEEAMVDILERVHAAFWHLGLAAVEQGLQPEELNELALFQTAMTAVWINSAIDQGTVYASNDRDILRPPLWQIRRVMELLRGEHE